MKDSLKAIGPVALLALALCGCNVGMAPEGPNQDQIRQEISAMPPEKQIHLIQGSPMSASEKQQKIEEIEKKYGISASSLAAPTGPPVPAGQGKK